MSIIRFYIGYFISLYLISRGKVSNIVNKVLNGDIILSIYFHNPNKKTVESLINWSQRQGFQFISSEELVDILNKKKKFPRGAVYISIDDGWKENLLNIFKVPSIYEIPLTLFTTIEPIINNNGFWWSYIDMGIKMGFDIPKKEILKEINNKERLKVVDKMKRDITIHDEAISLINLRRLASENNITIGSHTYSHPILRYCSEKEMNFEIAGSKKILEEHLNKNIKYFAYPNGIHRKREMDCVKNSGYEAAFGTDPDYISKNANINVYNIPRFEISDHVSIKENICRMTGVWYSLKFSKRDNA